MRGCRVSRVLALVAFFALVVGARGAQAGEGVDEVGARGVLTAWLAAQNDGDLRAYNATYAQKFYGVKRSGPRTTTFDRAGWLKDRARMFRKKMIVTADAVAIRTATDAAVVTFNQTWASGTYKDTGAKQLVIVREGPRLVIAREEMLVSELADGPGKGASPPTESHAFVLTAGDSRWIVLAQDGVESIKGTGALKLVGEDPAFVVQEATGLPAPLAAWKGRAVRLYDADEGICDAKVEGLYLATRFWPHFGMTGAWHGTGDAEGEAPMPPDRIAAQAWEMLEPSQRIVVGRLSARTGSCGQVLWARDAAAPAPVVAAPIAAGKALQLEALGAFRKLSAWARIQKEYQADATGEKTRDWTDYEQAHPQVHAFRLPDGRTFVTATAGAGSGCGDFRGELWAAWEVKGTEAPHRLVLLSDEGDPGGAFEPRAVMDLDGDGNVEIMGTDQLQTPSGAVLRPAVDVSAPSFDCPC